MLVLHQMPLRLSFVRLSPIQCLLLGKPTIQAVVSVKLGVDINF